MGTIGRCKALILKKIVGLPSHRIELYPRFTQRWKIDILFFGRPSAEKLRADPLILTTVGLG
jgi:hypothetical protein